MQEIQIRKYLPGDRNFILSSWIKSYKNMSGFAKRIPMRVYAEWHPNIVQLILDKPWTQVNIACSPDDSDEIIGYIVYSNQRNPKEDRDDAVVHYVFVKLEFQRQKVAQALLKHSLPAEPPKVSFTHWTYPVDEIIKKYPVLEYNPYLI